MSRLASLVGALALVFASIAPARADVVLRPILASMMLAPGGAPAAKAPAPGGPSPEIVALGDVAGPAEKISLPDLLQLTVRQSPSLASATIDVEIAAAQVEESLYLDDWTIQGQAQASYSPGSFLGQGFSKNASLQATLSRGLSTGGTVSFHGETDWSHTKSPFFEDVQSTDLVYLGLTQPLMRGRGRKVARALQVENALLQDAAELTRRQQAINVVESVVTGYWDLVAAQRTLEIAQGSLDLARERLRVTQIGVNGGKVADSELLAVEEAIATRQSDVVNAEVAVLQQSLNLRRTIGLEIGPGHIALDGGADLTVPARTFDLNDLLAQAEHASPQLASLAKQDANATIQIEVTENGLLPQLDVAAQIGPDGVRSSDGAPTYGPAAKAFVTGPGVYATGQLTFSQSIGRHQVYGTEKVQRGQREKIRVNATDLKLQIAQSMAQAVALVRSADERVQLAHQAVALAQKNILVEQSRFELGKSTNFDVLLRQDDLRQAQLREAQAQVDWHKAQAVIAALTGTLLADYGIDLGAP